MLPDNPKTFEFIMTLPTDARATAGCFPKRHTTYNTNPCTTNQQQLSIFTDLNQQLSVENIMPGIYLTKNCTVWSEEKLRSHGFTHVIIIDKHMQELYYPTVGGPNVGRFKLPNSTISIDEYDHSYKFGCSYLAAFTSSPSTSKSTQLNFGKEFEVIDLNFGEKSYLTTVLPNCYKAVKFIDKALQVGGTTLVVDCNGGEQKCLTIIVAYLMYKNNLSFCDAFSRLKGFYKKADLDRFYINQLYEYEPILQVQRAQSRGHSCSRELHAAILKRKKLHDDLRSNNSSGGNNINTSNNGLLYSLNRLTNFHHTSYQTKRSSFSLYDDYAME